ncbi:unnamed protein product [Protopolystoma xenopodis]|uniref:Uncharacterized protein n=1 Tax=Protopolystoma xenopodis TaxID=117903 RepID=A0A3S5A5K2_9PLAT|nr:unnamed protein product [Protopolystoma xenopodis]
MVQNVTMYRPSSSPTIGTKSEMASATQYRHLVNRNFMSILSIQEKPAGRPICTKVCMCACLNLFVGKSRMAGYPVPSKASHMETGFIRH